MVTDGTLLVRSARVITTVYCLHEESTDDRTSREYGARFV